MVYNQKRMIKLIIGFIVAGLIASGVYYYAVYSEQSEDASQNGQQIQNSLDAIEGAGDAVQQQQNRASDIQQQAQDAVSNPYDY